MRRFAWYAGVWLLASGMALAQAGTNNAGSQQEINSATGRAADNMTSPDINQHLTGNIG